MGQDAGYFDREYFRLHEGKRRYLERLVVLLRRETGDGEGPQQGETGARLLDVGSGFGFLLGALQEAGFRPVGLEISPLACAATRRDSGASVICQSAEQPFACRSGAFDAVTLWDVIEHLEDFQATLDECFRVLRPGGRLWVTTLNARSVARLLLGRQWSWYKDPTHVHLFSGRDLAQAFHRAGFSDVRQRTFFNLCSVGESTPFLQPLRIGRFVPVPWFGDTVLVRGTRPDIPVG